jgi:hypothetical protein
MPVDARLWLQKLWDRYSADGVWGILRGLYYAYVGVLLYIANRRPLGTNVFRREWDLLIILDACRYDAMCAVADEYPWIEDVGSIVSVGSTSFEWLPMTFRRRHAETIAETAYVTSNPYTTPIFRGGGATGQTAHPVRSIRIRHRPRGGVRAAR